MDFDFFEQRHCWILVLSWVFHIYWTEKSITDVIQLPARKLPAFPKIILLLLQILETSQSSHYLKTLICLFSFVSNTSTQDVFETNSFYNNQGLRMIMTAPLIKLLNVDGKDEEEKKWIVTLNLNPQNFRSSTSKIRVEFAGIRGGYPLLPYA